jgi:hypothetical protein
MAVIDKDLVRAINSGNCFALIGAGPSCETGLPSWKQLAERVIAVIDPSEKNDTLLRDCKRLISQKKYANFFSKAEKAIGRENLLSVINSAVLTQNKQGYTYRHITLWPFPVYLTTNFDDCLIEYLRAEKLPFSLRRNSQDDMRVLRADTKNLVFKIHGDPTVPKDIVLTAEDYLNFRNAPEKQYWRDKVFSVLSMINLVLIGYSASDPDFQDQLDRAKKISSPLNPVFMFAADINTDEIAEYYQKYNIRVISYKNKDGMHRELHNLLRRYDPFIAKRGSPFLKLEPIDETVATLASSLYLFTQVHLVDTTDACIQKIYASVILQVLSELPTSRNVKINTLMELLKEKTFAASSVDPPALDKALDFLYSVGFITLSFEDRAVSLEPKGLETLATIKAERSLLRERFDNSCLLFLKSEYPSLGEKSATSVVDALHKGLVRAYENRGMEIAASVFSNRIIDLSDATDILETINKAASILLNGDERLAFSDLMLEVILRPGPDMKDYMAALSQGYFAYHALGLEPRCSQERLTLAKAKKWILDSSILLPVLAIDCLNHLYAKDLLKRMQDVGLHCYTTGRLFDEVLDHASWAIKFSLDKPPQSPQFIQAALAGPGYRQNLFLDGFMAWSVTQGAPSFEQYMAECLDSNFKDDLLGSIKKKIETCGIEIIDFDHWSGFSQDLYPQRDHVAAEIEKLRTEYGTYRGEAQCTAEAEVVIIFEIDRAAFLSQTNILNKITGRTPQLTWKPEAMYRFLSLFSSTPPGADLLYDCMIQDFYYAGFDIVNKEAVSRFITPMIRQARMRLDSEKARYEEALGPQKFAQLSNQFDRVADEQKPFYSMQFAFYVANQEIAKRKAAEAAAKKAKEVKAFSEKERKEFSRLKAKKLAKQKKAKKNLRRFQSRPHHKK